MTYALDFQIIHSYIIEYSEHALYFLIFQMMHIYIIECSEHVPIFCYKCLR